MRISHCGLGVILLIGACAIGPFAHGASLWADRLAEIVPANVELTKVEESSGYRRIVGEAKSNADISALMRGIDQAGLGSPELQSMARTDNRSEFVLRVKASR